jgi:hypothetical protein
MEYHAIILNMTAVVRQQDHGITDREWSLKCRTLVTSKSRRQALTDELLGIGYLVLDEHDWKDYLQSLDNDEFVPNNKFIYSGYVKKDKWDASSPIY